MRLSNGRWRRYVELWCLLGSDSRSLSLFLFLWGIKQDNMVPADEPKRGGWFSVFELYPCVFVVRPWLSSSIHYALLMLVLGQRWWVLNYRASYNLILSVSFLMHRVYGYKSKDIPYVPRHDRLGGGGRGNCSELSWGIIILFVCIFRASVAAKIYTIFLRNLRRPEKRLKHDVINVGQRVVVSLPLLQERQRWLLNNDDDRAYKRRNVPINQSYTTITTTFLLDEDDILYKLSNHCLICPSIMGQEHSHTTTTTAKRERGSIKDQTQIWGEERMAT